MLIHPLPALVGYMVLGKARGEVNTIVEVPAPKHVVMSINSLPLLVKIQKFVSK